MTQENKDAYFTPGMKEWCFYREGMSPEEFEAEYRYMGEHFDEYRAGTYKPMWKQREEQNQ